MKRGHLNNPNAQGALRGMDKLRDRQLREDMTAVLGLPQGRRFLWNLIDSRCGVFSGSYTGNSETFLREGRRGVGIEVMELAQEECPGLYVQMVQEALQAGAKERVQRQAAEAAPPREETHGSD